MGCNGEESHQFHAKVGDEERGNEVVTTIRTSRFFSML